MQYSSKPYCDYFPAVCHVRALLFKKYILLDWNKTMSVRLKKYCISFFVTTFACVVSASIWIVLSYVLTKIDIIQRIYLWLMNYIHAAELCLQNATMNSWDQNKKTCIQKGVSTITTFSWIFDFFLFQENVEE